MTSSITLSIMTLSIKKLNTISIMTFSIKTLNTINKMTLSITLSITRHSA